MTNYIIGISAFYHDSAAALLANGELIAAAQEERFSRVKQDNRFPVNAIKFCLKEANIDMDCVDSIFYYENPYKKLHRIISTYFNYGLKGYDSYINELPSWLAKKVHIKSTLKKQFKKFFKEISKFPSFHLVDHHESHAASAFFASPFENSAILCIDGVGEWATTSAWQGESNRISPLWQINFPHSLGLLYSAFTYFCGFKVDSGEYKLMGLAPYGIPRYRKKILDHLIDVKPDGSFWLNMEYFDYATGNRMISAKFEELFDGPRREPESLLTTREFDLAASIQSVLEDIVILLAKSIKQQTGAENLCMAGGVALNCVANGKILKSNIFNSIWVQPAAGDSGGALGAAYSGWFTKKKNKRIISQSDLMKGSFLGSSYHDKDIVEHLDKYQAKYIRLSDTEFNSVIAKLLSQGNVIGWFQGKMEFGPRALGARSILGDPRKTDMQSTMNLKIKNRESFRPFAPAVLEEHAHEWFKIDRASSYMLFVVPIQEQHRIDMQQKETHLNGIEKLKLTRSTIPAVTHVDYSARVQTVNKKENPKFYDLINAFYQLTHCPVVINTSFNVRGEPIVESPSDAYVCFMRTQMDYLVVGNFLLKKNDQPLWVEKSDWRNIFELD